MPTIMVCKSGGGFYNGAGMYESVAPLNHLEQAGAQSLALAPHISQVHFINQLTGEEMSGETRNVMITAAPIIRGRIDDVAKFGSDDRHAPIFPDRLILNTSPGR